MDIADKLKQEVDLSVELQGFETNPDTPQEGMLLSTMFPQPDAQNMFRNLRDAAAPSGILFADIARSSNSRMSLEASEFAKANGRFDQFHSALSRRYYSEGMDIGSLEVLAQIGQDAGSGSECPCAGTANREIPTKDREYAQRGGRLSVTAAPTFIIEDRDRIIGAQPIEVFTKKLRRH